MVAISVRMRPSGRDWQGGEGQVEVGKFYGQQELAGATKQASNSIHSRTEQRWIGSTVNVVKVQHIYKAAHSQSLYELLKKRAKSFYER